MHARPAAGPVVVTVRSGDDLRALLGRVSMVYAAIPTELRALEDLSGNGDHALVVTVIVPSAIDGDETVVSATLAIDPELGDDDVIELARRAIRAVWLHEADEALRVDGWRRWDPHLWLDGRRLASTLLELQ